MMLPGLRSHPWVLSNRIVPGIVQADEMALGFEVCFASHRILRQAVQDGVPDTLGEMA